MNMQTVTALVPIVVKLGQVVEEMIENWDKKDYVPVMPEELKASIERLKSLPDLTSRYPKETKDG